MSKLYGLNQFSILIASGIQIPCEAQIGQDFHIIHLGNIIIHPDAIIGNKCSILPGVIIGTNMKRGAPVIGNNVFIGAGSKVLGAIIVGDGSKIAASSLVTIDVPPSALAIGVPTKIINIKRSIRPHDSLGDQTPDEVYLGKLPKIVGCFFLPHWVRGR